MSPGELIGIISALFALLCVVLAFVIRYILAHHTAVLQSNVIALAKDLTKLEGRFEQRSKDKDEFDYKFRHEEYVNTITSINTQLFPLPRQVEKLEAEIDVLRRWRHETVDPYIPRVLDTFKDQIDRLNRKVFNGHREHEK